MTEDELHRMGETVRLEAPEREVASTKSLRNALRLLMEFGGPHRDYGVGELAERCGLSKSQVSKMLAAFSEFGLLVQDPESRRYAVGARLFALGSRFVTYDPLCREAIPVMRDVVARTGHSARLSVLDGEDVLYLLGIEGPLFVDTGWRSGTWLPVHSTSAGRVILAFMNPDRAERILARCQMRAMTDQTVTDREEIRRLIAQTRERGYACQRGETTPALGTIAVPIFGYQQRVLGSLGIAFPVHAVTARDEPRLADVLHEAARGLSQRVGGTAYPFGGTRMHAPPPGPLRRTAAQPGARKANGPDQRRNP